MSFGTHLGTYLGKALVSILLLLAFGAEPLFANPVLVARGEIRGQGLARPRDGGCRVITSGRIVDGAEDAEVRVVGTRGSAGTARFESRLGDDGELAVLAVTGGAAGICTDDELAALQGVEETSLLLRRESGELEPLPVVALYESDRVVGLAARGESGGFEAEMRGAVVVEQGLLKGLLTAVDPSSGGRLASGRHADDLVERLGPWVRTPPPLAEIDRALDVLDRVVETRPTGDVGQVVAVERLVRQGSGLAGMDLAGLSFDGAALGGAELSEAVLSGASFRRTVLRRADLSQAHLGFARLDEARLEGAVLEAAHLYFAVADGAVLDDARAASSNWTAASARGASFRGADLRGASFKFADLTGADFTGADLTETLFIGAILEDATFEGATVRNTDATSAHGDVSSFTPEQQRELCATLFHHQGEGYVELTRVVPSTRFDSGRDYDQIASGHFDYEQGLSRLDPCELRQHRPAGVESVWTMGSRELIKGRYDFHYPASLLDTGGRRADFVGRFRDQLRRLREAVERGRFIEVPGETRRALTEALEENVGKTAPLVAELPLDGETVHLLALRLVPGYADSMEWQGRAAAWLKEEEWLAGRRRQGEGEEPRWPRFFPEGFMKEQVSPEHGELFERWTLARAREVPTLYRLSFDAPRNLAPAAGALRAKYQPEPPPSMAVVPLSEVYLDTIPEPVLAEIGEGSHGFTHDASPYFEDLVVVLDHPLESYRLDVPMEFAESLGRRAGQLELRIRIEDLELVEVPGLHEDFPETYAVARSELVGMRLVGESGAAFPEELPTRGSHPVATLRQAASRSAFVRQLCALYDVPAEAMAELRRKLRPDLDELPWALDDDPKAERLETQQAILRLIGRFEGYADIYADYYVRALTGEAPRPSSYSNSMVGRYMGRSKELLEPPEACE